MTRFYEGIFDAFLICMTKPDSNLSPTEFEPVSQEFFAADFGKGFDVLETEPRNRRRKPKFSVSATQFVRFRRACPGYVGIIQNVKKYIKIRQLDGGGRSPAKPVCVRRIPC